MISTWSWARRKAEAVLLTAPVTRSVSLPASVLAGWPAYFRPTGLGRFLVGTGWRLRRIVLIPVFRNPRLLTGHDVGYLPFIDGFELDQGCGHGMQRIHAFVKYLLGAFVI